MAAKSKAAGIIFRGVRAAKLHVAGMASSKWPPAKMKRQ
jgi:hypothetical protein